MGAVRDIFRLFAQLSLCLTVLGSQARADDPLLLNLQFSDEKSIEWINIKTSDVATLDKYYDKKINSGVEMQKDSQYKTAKTCREYLSLKAQEFFPIDARQISIGGSFLQPCMGLEIMRNAVGVSGQHLLSGFPSDSDLKKLPSPDLINLSAYADKLCSSSDTLESCLKKTDGNMIIENKVIKYNGKNTWAFFTPMVLGDFNDNERADIAIFYATGVNGGSLKNFGYICFEVGEESYNKINCTN